MYRYGISYFRIENGQRVPITGLEVRLVKPRLGWETGIVLKETGQNSGFYESDIIATDKAGYFDIWDNKTNANVPSMSGKSVVVGCVDSDGIEQGAVNAYHLADESITSDKIAKDGIYQANLKDGHVSLAKLSCIIENQTKGIGYETGHTPAIVGSDKTIVHTINLKDKKAPLIFLSSMCDCPMFISEIKENTDTWTVKLTCGEKQKMDNFFYNLIVLRAEVD